MKSCIAFVFAFVVHLHVVSASGSSATAKATASATVSASSSGSGNAAAVARAISGSNQQGGGVAFGNSQAVVLSDNPESHESHGSNPYLSGHAGGSSSSSASQSASSSQSSASSNKFESSQVGAVGLMDVLTNGGLASASASGIANAGVAANGHSTGSSDSSSFSVGQDGRQLSQDGRSDASAADRQGHNYNQGSGDISNVGYNQNQGSNANVGADNLRGRITHYAQSGPVVHIVTADNDHGVQSAGQNQGSGSNYGAGDVSSYGQLGSQYSDGLANSGSSFDKQEQEYANAAAAATAGANAAANSGIPSLHGDAVAAVAASGASVGELTSGGGTANGPHKPGFANTFSSSFSESQSQSQSSSSSSQSMKQFYVVKSHR